MSPKYPSLRPFVVHGHDHPFRDEVVRYLSDELEMMPPVVLDGVASAGRTVIEKFEEEASKCNLAVVLLTPDDAAETGSGALYRTARPNVWIELGYFMAKFGRKTGRTILIYRKGLSIPTDLAGVLYIDATEGITSPNVAQLLITELNGIMNSGVTLRSPEPLSVGAYRVQGLVTLDPAE